MNQKVLSRLESLDTQLHRLLKELEPYSDEMLNRQPGPGRWSVLQVMQHLMRAEELSFLYLQKKLSHRPALNRANFSTALREWLLGFYLRVPIKFKAPQAVDADQFPLTASFQEVSERWLVLRADLRNFLEQLPEEAYTSEAYRHPLAGRITLDGMMVFFDTHLRRHRRQIRRTLGQV